MPIITQFGVRSCPSMTPKIRFSAERQQYQHAARRLPIHDGFER